MSGEEDVNALSFGENFEDVEFIANASVSVLLTAMKNKRLEDEAAGRISDGPRVNEAFDRALQFSGRFGGALQGRTMEDIDVLFEGLSVLMFTVPTGKKADERRGFQSSSAADDELNGGINAAAEVLTERRSLASYEIVALTNLNPSTVSQAKALIPSLEVYIDDELEEAIKLLRKSSLKGGNDLIPKIE
jgi:hypothetical protein